MGQQGGGEVWGMAGALNALLPFEFGPHCRRITPAAGVTADNDRAASRFQGGCVQLDLRKASLVFAYYLLLKYTVAVFTTYIGLNTYITYINTFLLNMTYLCVKIMFIAAI